MRRPRHEAYDSLELTLGCMWDNFGNIILIALLVTILARETTSNQSAGGSPDSLQRDLGRAHEALADALAAQADLARESADPDLTERLKLVEQRQALRQAAEREQALLRAANDRLAANTFSNKTSVADIVRAAQAQLVAVRKDLVDERARTGTLNTSIQSERRRFQEKQRQMLAANAQRVRHLRLPREHQTAKTFLYIIVRYGRLYPIFYYRNGEPQQNTVSIRWTVENPNSRRLEPDPEQGLAVLANEALLAQFFHQFPVRDVYLVFQVYEDSFAAFNAAKEAAVAQGLEYTWQPRRADEVMRAGAGVQAPPPQ